MADDKDKVRLEDIEERIGAAEELTPNARARLGLARWILGCLALIFIASSVLLVFGPECSIEQSKEVFDFVKTFVPPIVTLVIGFYFRNESA